MNIIYSSKFEREYRRLTGDIKKLAENKEKIFRNNPHDSKLKTHKLGGSYKKYWAFSINYSYRIIFEFRDNGDIWFHSVGTHEIYR